LEVVHDGVVM